MMIMVAEEEVEEVVDLLRSKAEKESERTVILNTKRMYKLGKEEGYEEAADIVEENILN